MRIGAIVLYLIGISFCTVALTFEHDAAWPAAAMCFFSGTVLTISQKNRK